MAASVKAGGAYSPKAGAFVKQGGVYVAVGGGGATVPGQPGAPVATAGDGTVSAAWTAPASNGGSAITDYRLRWNGGTPVEMGDADLNGSMPAANGTAGTLEVAARNAIGWGPYSPASNSVTPQAAGGAGRAVITQQPQSQTAQAGATATFSFAAANAVSYRWQVANAGSTVWTLVSGQLTATLVTGTLTEAMDGRKYRGYAVGSDGVQVFTDEVVLHVGAASETPFALQAETRAVATAATAAGSSMSDRRLGRLDRLVERAKAVGAWSKLRALYLVGETEAQWQINLKTPGTNNLVKVGTPVYDSNFGATFATAGSRYDTGIALNTVPQDDVSMGLYTPFSAGVAVSADAVYDVGAVDGSGVGLAIRASSAAAYKAHSVEQLATTGYWDSRWWHSLHRTAAASTRFAHHGVTIDTHTVASAAPTVSTTITIGSVNGGAGQSARRIGGFYLTSAALTPAEQEELHAALQDYCDCVQHGDPMLYPAGKGPMTIDVDIAVYGASMSGICSAYEASRVGKTVAIIGGWEDETIWDLGGMPVNGLQAIDVLATDTVTMAYREMLIWARRQYLGATTDGTTTDELSVDSRAQSMAVRHMLDPTRAHPTLPGRDVPIYMSNGINGATTLADVAKGTKWITSITTRDGRTITAKQYLEASYDGDLVYYSGVPRITGAEAAGTGLEAEGGYSPVTVTAQSTSPTTVSYPNISAYVVPGDSASGLLPFVKQKPSLATGVAWNGPQEMTIRVPIFGAGATDKYFWAPWWNKAPAGYNPLQYEALARVMEAYSTANGAALPHGQVWTVYNVTGSAPIRRDYNNGPTRLFSNSWGSGVDYNAAGMDIEARREVVRRVANNILGYFHWVQSSGDARLAGGNFAPSNFSPCAAMQLDPGVGSHGALYLPRQVYRRDPTFRLKNAGFVFDANDAFATDGTTPRSTKTISVLSYRGDRHRTMTIQEGGMIRRLGGLEGAAFSPGNNSRTPLPAEAAMPDKAECGNLAVTYAASATMLAISSYRMEPAACHTGMSMVHYMSKAIDANIAIQDVDYAEVRADLLAVPYTYKPLLPQVN